MAKKKKNPEMMVTSSKFIQELSDHIRAAYPTIIVVTDEQNRLYAEVKILAEQFLSKQAKNDFSVARWTCTNQWTINGKKLPEKEDDIITPLSALMKIKDFGKYTICIMENFHLFLGREAPDLIQAVKDLSATSQSDNKPIIFANSSMDFPEELKTQITVLYHDLPTSGDIERAIERISKQVSITLPKNRLYRVREACKGMDGESTNNALAYSVVKKGDLDEKIILAEKCKNIRKSEMLEYVESEETFERIGGLERLKHWLMVRKITFTEKANKYHLRFPRGCILVGVPGCGKSLIAKAVANMYGIPLVRFDISAIFSKYVGESEGNIRKALKMVEALAPCVLWVDELEKGLSGAGGSNSTDGGTTPRVFGTLLQWQNDHNESVFFVATSNNLDALPPEFTRKGRIDELFFVDIPNVKERREIFRIQLQRQKLKPEDYDLDKLTEAAKDFTGAEIERAIEEAKILCANEDRLPETEDVIKCVAQIIPEAKKNEGKINDIRKRASQIAVPASLSEKVGEIKIGDSPWKGIDDDNPEKGIIS